LQHLHFGFSNTMDIKIIKLLDGGMKK